MKVSEGHRQRSRHLKTWMKAVIDLYIEITDGFWEDRIAWRARIRAPIISGISYDDDDDYLLRF